MPTISVSNDIECICQRDKDDKKIFEHMLLRGKLISSKFYHSNGGLLNEI